MGLVNEILNDEELEAQIEDIKLIPSSGGRYEIIVNGELVYAKKAVNRHANPGEVYKLIKEKAG